MAGKQTDTETAHAISLPYARLELRIVAFILDVVVLVSCLMLFVAVAGLQILFRSDFGDTDPPESAYWVGFGIVGAFLGFAPIYYVALTAWKGQTLGKMAVRIKVIRRDGGAVGAGQSFIRWVGYLASVVPLGIGFLMALVNAERRGLHDLLAGTVVVELP